MIQSLSYTIESVAPYINWIYFFHAWGFPPRFASIAQIHNCPGCRASWKSQFAPEEQERAEEAIKLYEDAESMLQDLNKKYHTYVRFGLFDANSDGDDILLWEEDKEIRLPFLRQQHRLDPNKPFLCLSDFIRPLEQGIRDRMGVFCATVDAEIEHLFEGPEHADDYRHLLCQTLADRLAEASVEKMHEEVRKKYWGYAPDENLSIADLLVERYQGIRPAVGYPSMPDQSMNFELDRWIDFSQIGISITESGAMIPHGSVSGLIMAHPQSQYFAIGKIGEDQLNDYAKRKGVPVEKIRKFLAANLSF